MLRKHSLSAGETVLVRLERLRPWSPWHGDEGATTPSLRSCFKALGSSYSAPRHGRFRRATVSSWTLDVCSRQGQIYEGNGFADKRMDP